jgi:hypothetical protein
MRTIIWPFSEKKITKPEQGFSRKGSLEWFRRQAPSSHSRSALQQQIDQEYVEYVKKFHPDLDLQDILHYSWIRTYELEDQGHWFSQWRVDRFTNA